MSRIAKISTIPKTFSKGKTLESSLQDAGYTRMPGTGVFLFPFKENDGTFRTALDSSSVVYQRIEDKEIRELKQQIADKNRADLEKRTRLRLDKGSQFYNFGFAGKRSDGSPEPNVEPFKLMDGDNKFDLDEPMQAITFAWLSVHPKIAASLDAYNNGDYPSDTQFYVKDEEAEAATIYVKKKEFNDAIIKFSSFSPDKKKKIARLCGLAAYENTREEIVYNDMDNFLNQKEIQTGPFKGQNAVRVFNLYSDLDANSLYVKDLVEQAFKNQIYRLKKGGKVTEGEQEIYRNKEELLEVFLDPKNQDEVLALEKKLKMKKLASA
jgi:hypothetical protein